MKELPDNRAAHVLAGIGAVFVWLVLIVQFYLQLTNTGVDATTSERIIRFFSYFTTLTNMIVAIAWTAVAFFPRNKFGEFFSRTSVQTAVAVYIAIVGLIYSLFLRVWHPDGWQKFADHSLHDVSPIAFLIFWLIFVPKTGLTWTDPLKWLVYPFAYMLYSLVRGAIVNWYPYWFADASQLGYPVALRNAFFVLAAFLIVGFIFAGAGKLIASRTPDAKA